MKRLRRLPRASRLRELLHYDEKTGHLTWLSGRRAGMRAGSRGPFGYRQIKIDSRIFREHRVVWKLVTGREPPPELDHKNRKRADNRCSNLRPLSREGQTINSRNPRNTSGVPGVWRRASGRWCAQFTEKRLTRVLGTFDTLEEAARVRSKAEREYWARAAA